MADPLPVVIVDEHGTEHDFPPGFDPKKAANIVRAAGAPPPKLGPLGKGPHGYPQDELGREVTDEKGTVYQPGMFQRALDTVSENLVRPTPGMTLAGDLALLPISFFSGTGELSASSLGRAGARSVGAGVDAISPNGEPLSLMQIVKSPVRFFKAGMAEAQNEPSPPTPADLQLPSVRLRTPDGRTMPRLIKTPAETAQEEQLYRALQPSARLEGMKSAAKVQPGDQVSPITLKELIESLAKQ